MITPYNDFFAVDRQYFVWNSAKEKGRMDFESHDCFEDAKTDSAFVEDDFEERYDLTRIYKATTMTAKRYMSAEVTSHL